MPSQLVIRIDDDLKKKVSRFALAEGKNTSQIVRELLEQYVNERDISGYIDQLWDRIGQDLKQKGIDQDKVTQAILDVRQCR
jgi:predicted DNA-binding protein